MKEYKDKILIFILCIIIFAIFFIGPKKKLQNVEDLDIYVGIGSGYEITSKGSGEYTVLAAANVYKEDESVVTGIRVGRGKTVGKTREDRQRKTGKIFFLGLIKIYVYDEEYAKNGIRPTLDIVFKNPIIDENAYMVVCKGKNENYFESNFPGIENPAEYMSDMVKNSVSYNFFKENYTFRNVLLSLEAEGRNAVVPYISMDSNGIKISGMAVFNKDKLLTVLDMNDTRTMNMLRENKVRGALTLQDSASKSVNYMAKTNRKVKCVKVGDKYNFTIDLKLDGEILDNEMYANLTKDPKIMKRFESDMENHVEEDCNRFIDKMQNQFKYDFLQLGWVASAKYGKETGVDWNDIVSNSNIKVNVKVKVTNVGRGQY